MLEQGCATPRGAMRRCPQCKLSRFMLPKKCSAASVLLENKTSSFVSGYIILQSSQTDVILFIVIFCLFQYDRRHSYPPPNNRYRPY